MEGQDENLLQAKDPSGDELNRGRLDAKATLRQVQT